MEASNGVMHLDLRRVERIGGIRLPLGTMSLAELKTVEGYCLTRQHEAATDQQIVRDTIDRRFPGGGAE